MELEEAKQKAQEHFMLHGGKVDQLKWFKACLDEVVEAARLSVWTEAKLCPECGEETKLSRICECGWWEESDG